MSKSSPLAVLATIAIVSILAMSVGLYLAYEPLVTFAFTGVGVFFALSSTFVVESWKRQRDATDLARALFEELAHQVSRCCHDAQATWLQYLSNATSDSKPSTMLRKFAPDKPSIFDATASRITLLDAAAPGALIRFYYRVSALRRDIENFAAEAEASNSTVDPKTLRFLAKRQAQTLPSGLHALQALAPMVKGHQDIEREAIAFFDHQSDGSAKTATLRERLESLPG